jgi:hypothetical protein
LYAENGKGTSTIERRNSRAGELTCACLLTGEKNRKKKREKRGRALSKTFPSLSPVLHIVITVSFCLYLEREKNDREDARIAEKKRESETFFSLPFHRARGVDIHKTTSRKRKKKRASFFFFGLGKLNWSIRNLQTLK